MSRFLPSLNIWNMKQDEIGKLQPGQWVYAGNKENKGIYLGLKKSGSVVVAWYGNIKQRKSYKEYVRSLRNYAISGQYLLPLDKFSVAVII